MVLPENRSMGLEHRVVGQETPVPCLSDAKFQKYIASFLLPV
jgi:hypothetical protein